MRKVVLILAALVFFGGASAQESVRIEVGFDCGVWATAREEHRAQYLEHYFLGLIDGLALGLSIELWRAGGVALSREQAYLWMDRYCANDPHRLIHNGALEFASERIKSAPLRRAK